uniref:Uncharacterized protein n=1 Tax=Romanomermis culicivorax TaxID=13658 RepID=A0A915JWM8_ROMCU
MQKREPVNICEEIIKKKAEKRLKKTMKAPLKATTFDFCVESILGLLVYNRSNEMNFPTHIFIFRMHTVVDSAKIRPMARDHTKEQ